MSGERSATLAGTGVVLRPYRGSADLKGVEAVRAAVRDADGDVWLPGPGGSDDPDAEHPFCLIAEADSGETVGFTWMQWWDEADRTRIYLLLGGIAPGWRRRGVGTALLRLMEERVAVVPGNAFGPSGAGHIRCSYATSLPQLEEALERMARFLTRVRG